MRVVRTRRLVAAACAAALAGGCQSADSWLRPVLPEAVANTVLKDGKFQADATAARGIEELNAAHEVYRGGNYVAAEKAFHKVAENTRNSPLVAEEARFYEAECLYQQEK